MTGKSGRGTARQTVRIDETLWAEFGDACEARGTDRSSVLRALVGRFLRDPDVVLTELAKED